MHVGYWGLMNEVSGGCLGEGNDKMVLKPAFHSQISFKMASLCYLQLVERPDLY